MNQYLEKHLKLSEFCCTSCFIEKQDYLLTHLNIDVDTARNYYFKHIRQWKKETLNYIGSNGEYERYSEQTLERDAESFAEEEWEKIEPYIK